MTALAARFADAYAADDVAAVVALLTDDAWLAMPPAAHEYHGRAAIAGFLAASAAGRAAAGLRLRLRPAGANRQPAFTCFLAGPRGEEASGVVVLEPAGRPGALAGVTRFLDPKLPALFGRGPGDRAVTAVTAGPRR